MFYAVLLMLLPLFFAMIADADFRYAAFALMPLMLFAAAPADADCYDHIF